MNTVSYSDPHTLDQLKDFIGAHLPHSLLVLQAQQLTVTPYGYFDISSQAGITYATADPGVSHVAASNALRGRDISTKLDESSM
jgi:hypothetical protein